MKDEIIWFRIAALEAASEEECTELGEYWALLCSLHPRMFDSASDEFANAYYKEIDEQYEVLLEIQEEDNDV